MKQQGSAIAVTLLFQVLEKSRGRPGYFLSATR